MPSIDILIPSYQYGRYLRDCVNSILGQGIEDLRILILDNASTDDSVEIARQIAAEDARIEVRTRESNLGLMASFNEGIDWASSPYFMIICADDLSAPGALERAISFMDQNPSVAFITGRELEHRQGEPLPSIDASAQPQWRASSGHDFIRERCRRPASFLALGTMVTRTSVQKRAGHYKAHLTYTEDVEMMLRLACFGDVAETSAVQGIRRLHGLNLSGQHLTDRKSDLVHRKAAFDSFLDDQGRLLHDAEQLRRSVNRNIALRALAWGARALQSGELREGWNLVKYAAGLSPMLLPSSSGIGSPNQQGN
ncbi:glycosyltransferase family 2 protein [Bradyrhizobium archetypum]|uniref:Glycosyltransferase family 2 protein n=1 Tax=Bradyrhizobium archetypum TaxID=2721160 RepID=A0A7Y4H4W1_9BRAD|nr:glycosyltransferase family 2 protein [Bradyrhizobium archetypum]NOJ47695.1 glycosyltransferase family 2 protein [Bradyrhizobium archetypum]